MMGLGKPQLLAKFVVASFSRCRNIKGKQKFWGAPLAQGHTHFSSGCDFMMGLGKPQLLAKFVVAGFICCGSIREFVFKRQIRFLSHPLGELGVTHGLYL